MEGDTFVRNQPHAHLQDSGAPPLLLGWLRLCRQVNSALFFKTRVIFTMSVFHCRMPPFCPRNWGTQCKFGAHAKKKFPALVGAYMSSAAQQ